MLKLLRKKGIAKKLLWVMAVMITFSFVFWGIASSLNKGGAISYAGKIFGKNVSFNNFRNALLHVQNQAIIQYGENFYKVKDYLNLESEAWDRLILLHEAKKRKIQISNDLVIDAVAHLAFFQRNGKFDPALYNQIVQYVFKCKPRDFEEGVRESIIFSKIYEQETDLIDVSDEEVLKYYENQNEKVDASYVLFPFSTNQSDISLSDEELSSYYENNKDNFVIPSTINIQYLALEYPLNATDEQKEATKEKASQVSIDIKNNSNLEDLANKYKLKVKESGFFSQEKPNLQLGWPIKIFEISLNLKEDRITNPIETAKGFYVLKLKEKKESYALNFDTAKEKVREILSIIKAKQFSEQKTKKGLAKIKEILKKDPNQSFESIARKLNLKINHPEPFTRGQYLPNIGPSPKFHKAAFALSKNNRISDPTEISTGYCIVYLNSFLPVDKKLFEEQKEFLTEKLLGDKKDKTFSSFLIRLRQKANIIDNIKKLKEAKQDNN